MDTLVSRASMIRLSLHPSPASETSAFNKIRALSCCCAALFPFRNSASSRSRSSLLNRTTYFFTEISLPAMIAPVIRVMTQANHQILSKWLKQATSSLSCVAHIPEGEIGNKHQSDLSEHGKACRSNWAKNIDFSPRRQSQCIASRECDFELCLH